MKTVDKKCALLTEVLTNLGLEFHVALYDGDFCLYGADSKRLLEIGKDFHAAVRWIGNNTGYIQPKPTPIKPGKSQFS